jgi:hypothetical protein
MGTNLTPPCRSAADRQAKAVTIVHQGIDASLNLHQRRALLACLCLVCFRWLTIKPPSAIGQALLRPNDTSIESGSWRGSEAAVETTIIE